MTGAIPALLGSKYLEMVCESKLYNALRLLRETIQRPEQADAMVLMTFPIYFDLQDRWDLLQAMWEETKRYTDASLFRALRSAKPLYTFPGSALCSEKTVFPFEQYIGRMLRVGILPMAFWRPSVIYSIESYKKHAYYLHQIGIADCAILIDVTRPDLAMANSLVNIVSIIRLRDLCTVVYAPNGNLGINNNFLEFLQIRMLTDYHKRLSEKESPKTTIEIVPQTAYDTISENSKVYPFYPREILTDCMEQIQKCLFDSCDEEERKKSLWPAINVFVESDKLKFERNPLFVDPESYSIFMNSYTPVLICYDVQFAYRTISEIFKQMLLKSISEQRKLVVEESQVIRHDSAFHWACRTIQNAI